MTIIVTVVLLTSSIIWMSGVIDGWPLFCPPMRMRQQHHYQHQKQEAHRHNPLHHSEANVKRVLHAKTKQFLDEQPTEAEVDDLKKKKNDVWVLLVEDESHLRNAIGKYVSNEGGYHVTGVADARSAFLLSRGIFKPTNNRYTSFKFDPNYNTTATTTSSFKRPDCIILDVRLGGEMDGIELLNIIRADALLESLPVILLTAKGKVDDRIAGYEAGADAYLTKPIDPEELLSVLEGVLRRDIVSSMRNDDHAAATEKDEVSLSKDKDSIGAMEEIKREILEIKSLLRQRNNNTFESAATSQDEIIDATSSSFGSMYKDLLEMKESIKVSLLDDKPVDESVQVYPKVTLSEINEQYFTPDETKVISLVEQGLTNREIGEEHLDCSISKVEKIISSLFKKTGTKKRPELVDWCKQNRVNERQQTVIQDVDDGIPESPSQLSEKEKEIMRLLGLGLTNKEIVAKTGVLLKDIVSVVDAMLAKAKVKNRTELMRWWNDEGNNNILL
ncbi:hypothetical protein ACHAWC_001020 [Mediolabrus comicus]